LYDPIVRGSRPWFRRAATACALIACACQTYRPSPPDLEAHHVSWAARSPDASAVRDLARRLSDSRPAAEGAFDASDGLSLAEAEAVALVYNADLRLARLRAAEASAAVRESGRWQDPVFGFDAEKILSGVSNPWILAASLGVTLPLSGRLDAEKRGACAEERAAIARVVAEEWAVRIRVRTAWLQWSFETLRVETTHALLDRLDGILTIATRLEEAGELPRIEARLFRAEQASRKIEMRAVDSRSREMALGIKSLLGLVPDAPLELVPATSVATHETTDVARNPHLAALRARYDVAEEALRLEVRKQFPDVLVAPGYRNEDGDPRVTLGLEIPIPLWNRNRKGIAEAAAKRETARAELETGYEALVTGVRTTEVALQTATAQRAELERILIPIIEEQSHDVQRVVALGQVNTLVMLDTLVRQHDASLKLIDARLQEALATIRLQELAGPVRRGVEESP
jgi:cobalt-zinc-cadmium efflux system outer membrane protein